MPGERLRVVFPVRVDDGFDYEPTENPQRPGRMCPEHIVYRDDFGAPRGGGARAHEAIDIFGPLGARVVSPVSGVVIGSTFGREPFQVEGHSVRVRMATGDVVRLSHLDTVEVQEGDELEAGEHVGTLGNTGNARNTCPHVHLVWQRPDGTYENPYPVLRATEAAPIDIDAEDAETIVELERAHGCAGAAAAGIAFICIAMAAAVAYAVALGGV